MNGKSGHTLLAALAMGLAASFAARAVTYTVTDVGSLAQADSGSRAYAVNAVGQVAGYSGHPFLFSRGGITDLNPSLPASVFAPAPARDVNDSGTVVGFYLVNAVRRPFRWSAGAFQDLSASATASEAAVGVNNAGDVAIVAGQSYVLKADGSKTVLSGFTAGSAFVPSAINDAGDVAGRATTTAFADHAAIWRNGAAVDLGVLSGDSNSCALGLNALGWAVGASYGPSAATSTLHAFQYRDGVLAPLPGRSSAESCVATAINSAGRVVGYAGALAEGGETAALMWENGEVRDLQTLLPSNSGWTLVAARDINDAGQIAGTGVFQGGYHGFLLTPVPVPGDANGDSLVTTQDAALALGMAVGLTPTANPDLLDLAPSPSGNPKGYGDGRLDALDVLRMLAIASQ
ncbi:MAG TPA: hypothetical protein VGM37_17835 [Armatimonadota bacterium]